MKTIKLLSLGMLLTGIIACAQKNEAPKAVTDAFAKIFPDATKVKWDKESDTEWEAEFKMNTVEYSANFEADGTWKETEHEINISEVPETVRSILMKDFADYKIKESEISETSDGLVYEFELKNGKVELEVAINKNGTVTKKIKEAKSNDNENENDD
jgi:uncharacterized membrane protein YkoI